MRAILLGTGGSAGVPHIGGAGRARRLGRLRPGRAAQPPHPLQHRCCEGGGGGRCWWTPRRTCARSCWPAASRGWTRCCSPMRMPTTSSGWTTCASSTGSPTGRWRRSAPRRRWTRSSSRFGYAFRPWQPPGFYRPVLVPRPIAPGRDGGRRRAARCGLFDQDHGYTRSLGLRVGGFGYSTDVVTLDEAAFAALEGVDTWVVGCFQRARSTGRMPGSTGCWNGSRGCGRGGRC